jgi:predicted NUDIX family NTP pyrophosphohydrolase
MAANSAGLLLYRTTNKILEVFLGHPGGPYYAKKDAGVWSIPKGEFDSEEPLKAAIREFEEETGYIIEGDFIELHPVKRRSGKMVYAWAVEADVDAETITSNTFTLEFPPKSGKMQEFPELDRAGWFSIKEARQKILSYQLPLLDEFTEMIQSGIKRDQSVL